MNDRIMDYVAWLIAGYKDYLEGTPGKRKPGEALAKEQRAYWDGWQTGLMHGLRGAN